MKTDIDFFNMANEDLFKTLLLKNEVYMLIHDFFANNQYVFVDPPILHEQIYGKKHEIYLPLFNNKYSLNSSNALFMAAYAAIYKQVYSISASFRNEQDSINHLLEFRMLEVEMQHMSFDDMLNLIESLLMSILKGLLDITAVCECIELKERILNLVSEFPITRVPYYELLNELNEKYDLDLKDTTDFSSIDYYVSGYLKNPLFVVDYPRKMASWTAKIKDEKTAYAFNLLLPDTYGELCEGCQRNNNAEQIKYKLNCAKITNLEWFVSSIDRMNGERCGFGLGIERLLRWIVGAEKISDVVYFPRIKESEKE